MFLQDKNVIAPPTNLLIYKTLNILEIKWKKEIESFKTYYQTKPNSIDKLI